MKCYQTVNIFGYPLLGLCPEEMLSAHQIGSHRIACAEVPETCWAHEPIFDDFTGWVLETRAANETKETEC